MSTPITYTEIRWDTEGRPHSIVFDDKYFCQENGYADTKHIYCEGNSLRERWENFSKDAPNPFVIAETGFGTGLSFLCAWEYFEAYAPAHATLHYISIEKFPMSVEDLKRTLSHWPSLKDKASELISQYPKINHENRSVSFANGKIKLTLIFDHVLNALEEMRRMNYSVDAWFLDGFAPAKNLEMWSLEVFVRAAALSHSGTTVATFTVAGHVRRGLIECGFQMKKVPGFGRKQQMLRGVYDRV